jgi:hypothetical protein
VNGLKNTLGIFPKGWRVAISYRRDGKTYDTFVRLMGVHTEAELLAKMDADKELEPPGPNPRQPGGRRPGGQPRPGQQPKPGDEPQPGQQSKPGEQPKPGDRGPGGEPKLPANPSSDVEEALQKPVPEELKKQFEERTGYANFYFNRENTNRVWKALAAHGDFSTVPGPWTIEGEQQTAAKLKGAVQSKIDSSKADQTKTDQTKTIAIHLADAECDIELPTGDTKITVSDGLDSQLNPPGSGGLLSALFLWRKLLIGGPSKYGQVTYGGTVPVLGHEGLCDVLVAIGNGVQTLFYCDPADGTLVAMEMNPDDDADPCEVYFSDYRADHGRLLPHHMEVHSGNSMFGVFTLTDFDLQKAVEKSQ